MTKNAGHEVSLAWDAAGGTVFTTIGQIIDIGGPGIERNAIDVSTRDSSEYWREFIKGFKDGGEVTFDVVLDLALAAHGTATGLYSDFNDDTTIPAWQMSFPNSKTITFDGILTNGEPSEPLDDALTGSFTVKVSGKPVIA